MKRSAASLICLVKRKFKGTRAPFSSDNHPNGVAGGNLQNKELGQAGNTLHAQDPYSSKVTHWKNLGRRFVSCEATTSFGTWSSIVLSCADLAACPTSTLSSQLRITAPSSLTDQSLRRGTDSDPFSLGRDQKQSHVTGQIFVVLTN